MVPHCAVIDVGMLLDQLNESDDRSTSGISATFASGLHGAETRLPTAENGERFQVSHLSGPGRTGSSEPITSRKHPAWLLAGWPNAPAGDRRTGGAERSQRNKTKTKSSDRCRAVAARERELFAASAIPVDADECHPLFFTRGAMGKERLSQSSTFPPQAS